jgi:hypothetical protein
MNSAAATSKRSMEIDDSANPSKVPRHVTMVSPKRLSGLASGRPAGSTLVDSKATASSVSCMIRSLHTDNHVFSVVCNFLPAADVATLHGSCTSWRDWITASAALLSISATTNFVLFPLLVCSTWAKKSVTSISLESAGLITTASMRVMLVLLSHLRRLRSLTLRLMYEHVAERLALKKPDTITVLSCLRELTSLNITADCATLNSLLLHADAAPRLERLVIRLRTARLGMSSLKMESLPRMKRLGELHISSELAHQLQPKYRCSLHVAAMISKCPQLHTVSVGSWNFALLTYADSELSDDEGFRQHNRDVNETCHRLVAASTGVKGKLTFIDFSTTVMNLAAWSCVSKFTNLLELAPLKWSDLPLESWQLLAGFKCLRRLELRVNPGFCVRTFADSILPHLDTLQNLLIQSTGVHMMVGTLGMRQLLSCKSLLDIQLVKIRFDFVALDAATNKLRRLALSECSSLHAVPLHSFDEIPSLPHLQVLTLSPRLQDSDGLARFTQRCPGLSVDFDES